MRNSLIHNAIGGGAKTHFGRIEDIVKDMFDNSDLYLVSIPALGMTKTYKKESILPLKKDKNKESSMV